MVKTGCPPYSNGEKSHQEDWSDQGKHGERQLIQRGDDEIAGLARKYFSISEIIFG